MSRPLTRSQALENRAFLNLLRRTGNVRLACREAGVKYGTMQDRRRKHPAFALNWDAAVVFAQARLAKAQKKRMGQGSLPLPQAAEGPFRTVGGEAHLVRLKNGKLQMRRAQAGRLTPAAEQAFLSALSVTCNVSLAAAAVGACFGAFNKRRRKDPAFAREMRMAIAQGYDALELALLEGQEAGSHAHDDWRANDPPAMPPMSVNQALQLMYLHQKEARLTSEPDWLRRRRGESNVAHCERLTVMAEERERRAREAFAVAEAERFERGEPAWGPAGEAVRGRMGLPDLAQVTGWSRADPTKVAHDEEVALFGGWRMEHMEGKSDRSCSRPHPAAASRRLSLSRKR